MHLKNSPLLLQSDDSEMEEQIDEETSCDSFYSGKKSSKIISFFLDMYFEVTPKSNRVPLGLRASVASIRPQPLLFT